MFVFCIKRKFCVVFRRIRSPVFYNRRTHFWETLWMFSHWSGPHDITFACGKWWKHGLSLFSHQGNFEQYFPLSFFEKTNVMSSFRVFFFQTVAVVVLKMSLGEWERVYLRKWSGLARYAVISVCQRHSSSLLCLWNQSQAVHYLLSPTHSSKAYLLSFSF